MLPLITSTKTVFGFSVLALLADPCFGKKLQRRSLISLIDSNMARYTDIDLNFTRNPITGDVSVRNDKEAVSGSIRNIILTMQGEKKFNPNFGGNVRKLLFEPIDPITTLKIEDED